MGKMAEELAEEKQLDRTRYLGYRGFPQADKVLTTSQKFFFLFSFVGFIAWGLHDWRQMLLVVNGFFTLFFLISTIYRFVIIDISLKNNREIQVHEDEILEPENGWPVYVVQVPLFHEGETLPVLVENLKLLDYPTDKLTIQLLIEEDDEETNEALEKIDLPAQFKPVIIPESYPRTKPKACNIGLAEAEGDFLVIFDAEDKPEPDQLKKAVIAFSKCHKNTVCLQGKLNFFNAKRNLQTRCFTAEYTMWFDLSLPGLDFLAAPIPLGGTSNHFKLHILKELGGWDEYNVTEDCDLGVRLFNQGYRTRVLDSTTWEEACPSPYFWIHQRSRWVKGYIQTYLVHMRNPLKLLKDFGLVNFCHFQVLIGGSFFSMLLSPFYWFLVILWFFLRIEGMQDFFPGSIVFLGCFCLFLGNFVFAYSGALACAKRGNGYLVKYCLFMPLYWSMISLGAWIGALQLIFKPHYWAKTKHFAEDETL